MKKTFSILLLILLVNCSATKNTTEEQNKPSINSVIEGFKGIQLPKLMIDMPF